MLARASRSPPAGFFLYSFPLDGGRLGWGWLGAAVCLLGILGESVTARPHFVSTPEASLRSGNEPRRGWRALGVSLSLAWLLCGCGPQGDRPLQGYVEGEYVRMAAPFAGTLQQLSVQRGGQVVAGAPLFALESENEIAARRQAEQQLHAAAARLENLKTGKRAPEVETVAEQLRQAMAARDLSAANLRRQEALAKSGFISAAALDDVRTRLRNDDAHVNELKALVATSRQPGARPHGIRA